MAKRLAFAMFLTVVLVCSAGLVAQQPDPESPRYKAAMAAQAFLTGDSPAEEFAETHLASSLTAAETKATSIERLDEIRASLASSQLTAISPLGEFAVSMKFENSDGSETEVRFDLDDQPPNGFVDMYIVDGPGLSDDGSDDTPADMAAGEQPDSELSLADQLTSRIDALVEADRFSGTALLARGDQVVFEGAWGMASQRFQVPNNIDTRFNLGSMNKMFTGVAICQLVERGLLSLDDTVGKHLPDYPHERVKNEVTIHHLLTHTSGMGSYWNDEYEKHWKTIRTVDDLAATFVNDPLEFEPGSQFGYSNAGPVVLGLIIEKATGQSYYDYVRQNIYEPAGMQNTDSYEMDRPVTNLAIGYTRSNYGNERDDGPRRNNLFQHSVKGGPAGGGFSTVRDMLKFSLALQNDVLLKPETRDLMLDGKILIGPDFEYAYLFGHHGREAMRRHGHNGGAPGISAEFAFYPELGYTYVVLSNYDEAAMPVGHDIQELVEAKALAENPQLSPSGPKFRVGIAFGRTDDGVMVEQVIEGGPAEKAGLAAGDRIEKINGEPLQADWFNLLEKPLADGTPISFDVLRDGDSLTIEVVPEAIK
ncbi:MAG: serine hydrolase [Pirellulaceae bacterium]